MGDELPVAAFRPLSLLVLPNSGVAICALYTMLDAKKSCRPPAEAEGARRVAASIAMAVCAVNSKTSSLLMP